MTQQYTRESLLNLLWTGGAAQYGYEPVTQLAHGLQAAALAEQADEPPSLIVAALLHDIGHLVEGATVEKLALGVDDHHEILSATALSRCFPDNVVEPVRWHVQAKRYLCLSDPHYYAALSDASKQSMALQGGLMEPGQVENFLARPYANAAVRLRRYDDRAKDPLAKTPGPAHFRTYFERV